VTQTLEVHQKRVSWSFAPELTKPLESYNVPPLPSPSRGEERKLHEIEKEKEKRSRGLLGRI